MRQTGAVFEVFFEQSVDAILLYDPADRVFIDCNQAAVELIGAKSRDELLQCRVEDLSPALQPGGSSSADETSRILELVRKHKGYRFEWMMRHKDGRDVPIAVSATPITMGGRTIHVIVSRDITDNKKAERELRELNHSLEARVQERTAALATSEARFRALVEHAPEAIVVFDGDSGKFLFGNEHARALYGVPMEKLAELTPADVSPKLQPNGRRSTEMARELMDEALAGGTPVFEWTHRRPDGHLIPTEVRLLRLPAEGQNLIRASIIDNSERKRAERALRESEEKFRALFEGCSQGVILHDEDKFLEVNSAAVRIMGCQSPQELIGKQPRNTSPPLQPNGDNSAELAQKYIRECLANGSSRFEWVSCTPQGQAIPLEVTLTRIQWSGRQVIQALLNDIRDRKKAEAEVRDSEARLRESEARFSAAFHASPIITAIFRVSDTRIVLANDAFLTWTGYTRDEVLGRTTLELGIWESSARREQFWEDVRREGTVGEWECHSRNRHGRLSTMLASGVIIEINGVNHLLTMMVDITQRKQAEEEMLKALAREKELSQLKSNFVSMVSHEFRTPLGIIQSSAELMRDFGQKMDPPERAEQLESITRNTRRMAEMMEEILVLSRLDAGKLQFRPVGLDLEGFCRRIVDEVLSATNRRCPIQLSCSTSEPAAAADEMLLGHIFTNLLSNAVKYSEPGVAVRFALERHGTDALCTIRDEGIGISCEDQQRLFKAFHRGGNVGTRPGSGLGLLMVKRCVEMHQGIVKLVSKLGAGTTVTVRLPLYGREL